MSGTPTKINDVLAAIGPRSSHEYSADEILMSCTLFFPNDDRVKSEAIERILGQAVLKLSKNRRIVAATWRNGITVVLGYPKGRLLPTPKALVEAFHEACAMRAMAELSDGRTP